MTNTEFGIIGVGNALVDVLAQVDDTFIDDQHKKHGMEKGAMTLVDAVSYTHLTLPTILLV